MVRVLASRRNNRPGENSPSGVWRKKRNQVLAFLLALSMFFVLREVAFQPFVIPSSSMAPTLKIDEKILVDKTGIVSDGVKRGDIVVFRDPGLWLGPAKYNPLDILGNISNLLRYGLEPVPSHLVKRVVAIGGDRVRCCSNEGQLVVNGAVISEPYILSPEGNASSIPFDVSVPADSFWVLGDNREGSADSRFHVDLPSQGFVKRRDVVGVVLGVFWPIKDFKWLSGANRKLFESADTPVK